MGRSTTVFGMAGLHHVHGCQEEFRRGGLGRERRGTSNREQAAEKAGETRGAESEIPVDFPALSIWLTAASPEHSQRHQGILTSLKYNAYCTVPCRISLLKTYPKAQDPIESCNLFRILNTFSPPIMDTFPMSTGLVQIVLEARDLDS